jgi:uncharacterized protein YqgQ
MSRNLPHPEDLLQARYWLFAGAPAASRDHDAKFAVKILINLVEALPAYFDLYCYGKPENTIAMMQRELFALYKDIETAKENAESPEELGILEKRKEFLENKILSLLQEAGL